MARSSGIECDPIQGLNVSSVRAFPTAIYPRRIFEPTLVISPLKRLGQRAQLGISRPAGAPIVERTDWRFQCKRSPQVIMRVTKVENKIVAAAARERLPVDFKSIVERETQDALVCPGCRENVLVLRERK